MRLSLAVRPALALCLALLAVGPSGCDPDERVPAKSPKAPPCPPPPEPAYQAAVVGTIGKLHLVESRYPLSRLGDVLASFKPDLVLLGVRVDPYREGHLEDASFEMTYVNALAKQHGIVVEPIDWFREQDLGAAPPAADPWDEAEIAKREGAILTESRLFTFDQANGNEIGQRLFLAGLADARHRGGDPLVTRRHAHMGQLVASAVERHGRPKKVLAYVDLLDRVAIDGTLHGLAYVTKEPAAIVKGSKDELIADIPNDVVNEWRAEQARAQTNAGAAKTPAEKAFWADRARILGVVVDKKAQCCVPQSAIAAPPPEK